MGGQRVLVVALAILVASWLVTLVPEVEVRVVAPGIDLVMDTVTTLITLAVGGLAWTRFRDRGQRAALFQAAAFAVLAVAGATAAFVALLSLDASPGSTPAWSGEDALYISTMSRLAAAALLVAGGAASVGAAGFRRPGLVVALPVAGVVLAIVLAPAWIPLMPPLVEAAPPTLLGVGPHPLPHATPVNAMLQSLGAALFGWAALLSRRRFQHGGSVADEYLAIGLVVAAIAQLHVAFHPSAFAGVIASGDLLYLVFDVILLLGILSETRAYIVDLRQANLRLEQLKDVEVERAAIEERARLSRELHDGLAQDLWLAKLGVGRLASLPDLGPDALRLCEEVDRAVDSGLADARQAVMALRAPDRPEQTFSELLERYVDEFGDRFGLRTEFECGPTLPRLAMRVEAELLRIAQEALNNVRRHADATVVVVRATSLDRLFVLSVRDNGRGFDPAATGGGGFGLISMRERATLIAGRLSIVSRPHDGTVVTVEVPVPILDEVGALVG